MSIVLKSVETSMSHFMEVRMPLPSSSQVLSTSGIPAAIPKPSSSPSPGGRRNRLSLWERGWLRVTYISFLLLVIRAPDGCAADNLGILGSSPKWKVLEHYQETITRDDFARLIQNVYCTHGFAEDMITIDERSARILTNR